VGVTKSASKAKFALKLAFKKIKKAAGLPTAFYFQ
jgi:hypothetical protein